MRAVCRFLLLVLFALPSFGTWAAGGHGASARLSIQATCVSKPCNASTGYTTMAAEEKPCKAGKTGHECSGALCAPLCGMPAMVAGLALTPKSLHAAVFAITESAILPGIATSPPYRPPKIG